MFWIKNKKNSYTSANPNFSMGVYISRTSFPDDYKKCTDMNEGKIRTYALFVTHFQKEKYLSVIKDVDVRKCFMSFRISSHKLEIEQGRRRHKKLDAKDRICKFCKSGTVEDEKHNYVVLLQFL